MVHELALNFLLVGLKVLNYPKSIKYILYIKIVSLKSMYQMCPLLRSNSTLLRSNSKV